jgi:hypothetical protein
MSLSGNLQRFCKSLIMVLLDLSCGYFKWKEKGVWRIRKSLRSKRECVYFSPKMDTVEITV